MRPTLEARALKASLLQYLSTTYALTDEGVRSALEAFLGDDEHGMFRGPFLRIRTPFVRADDGWRELLEWAPPGFSPYAHQALAFERLSSSGGRTPRGTLVTTGTGSGKTESFLLPILDHCLREKRAGRFGVKAVLLYPMNALATDQAIRLNDYLGHAALAQVTAGLYIGDTPATGYERVATRREDMRRMPPDILITNYKMLDLLLQRGDDVPLWRGADLKYIVVDEFHTYDGAQGTDVAMLLRRLAAALGVAEPGRPLGGICPVATSATLASGTDADGTRDLLEVAGQVFGTTFTDDAVIGELRLATEEFIPGPELDPRLPLPDPGRIAGLPDPARDDAALAELVREITGDAALADDPRALGAVLKRHMLTSAVMNVLADGVKTPSEVLDTLWRAGAYSWGQAIAQRPDLAATALARFIALLSIARDPDSAPERPRPFVHVEVHQWARAVSRLLRGVLPWPKAEFRWDAADAPDAAAVAPATAAPATTATAGQQANVFLPAVYCRDCGRSGWAVFTPESDGLLLDLTPAKIRRASTTQDKRRVRNLIAATAAEAAAGAPTAPLRGSAERAQSGGAVLMVLDGPRGRLRRPDRERDFDAETGEPALAGPDSAFVLVNVSDTADTAAKEDWCPACGERNAIRYLGTGPAALAAASITELFTGDELDPELGERKTLLFSDSVQDAAHRAGFVANRSYTFSLRALLAEHLDEREPTALNDLIADVVAATTDPATLAAVVPPDLHRHPGVARLLSGTGRGGDLKTWRLIGERLAFATITEFGFRSRQGRTLELTRTAAAFVHIADPAAAVEAVRAAHLGGRGGVPEPLDDAAYLGFVRVLLERLRSRGAVGHRWLGGFVHEAGTNRYPVWGGRPPGMPAFPKGVAAPRFLLDRTKERSEFDNAVGRLSWYERWAQRCLSLPRERIPELWTRLLPELVGAGLLSVRTAKDNATRVHGLQAGAIRALLLGDEHVDQAYVRCPVCSWEQTVHPLLLDQWHGQPCPSYRCATERSRLVAGDRGGSADRHVRERSYKQDYYRRLYREAGTYQVITAEHTGMLTRAQRETVEAAFRDGTSFNDPNVLACTPTLELGIDIGDLSAVVLASLPRTPANYAQRVGRAGRRTGNAYLLTIPDRRRRDLYFLDQPQEMIAGRIVPPGAHLSAVEILRRQYLAHILDLAACGRLTDGEGETGRAVRPLPRKAPQLFGASGYMSGLVDVAIAQADTLADGFLALFPTGVSDQAAAALREFAAHGLRGAVEAADRLWHERIDVLRDRITAIDATVAELPDADPEAARQKAELQAERRATGRQIALIGDSDAHGTLTELGLLPNYALIDTRTALDATLFWEEDRSADARPVYGSELREYSRPQRYAIAELAPGNTFYVGGYRHEITGLEIGSAKRRAWRMWRVCPGCGYVRTRDAERDRSTCPRCHTSGIADDGSCLHRVILPTRVTARDRREDAVIRDDRDERDQRYYATVTAVDIPDDTIEASWRHSTRVFGIDFSRRAVVRTVNVGPARFDIPATDDFAGHTVRLNPFHVCTACGAATADGRPVFDHDTDALTSSAARDPRLKHHRPWCPLRRGRPDGAEQVPVLLAHELETEALRVLLPAATVLVDEKVHSFRAALRLGVDAHFGGDPAHLDTTVAYQPDHATDERRSFLVLFDTLPGGTGYLHRLTDPDAFLATLVAARDHLLDCPCVGEGRNACHRCLLRYTPEAHAEQVSRTEALALIDELLFRDANSETVDGWSTTDVPSTRAVGLDAQIESDLEARFLALLRRWADVSDDAVLDETGRASGHLRIRTDRDVVHWRLTAQERLHHTRTDFTLTRADGPGRSVKVYLDGRRFHAGADHDAPARDAAARTRLRADGHTVFQLTWYDLELFEGRSRFADPVWPPYAGIGQDAAKAAYEQFGGNRAEFTELVFANPVATLLAYLRDPDAERWNRRARALVAGVVGGGIAVPVLVAAADIREHTASALRAALCRDDRTDPAPAVPGPGPIHVFAARDNSRLPLTVVLDARDPEAPGWTALAVLPDDAARFDEPAHRERWRAWLYWTNLIQFLGADADGGTHGDGVQLTSGQAQDYPVETLAVCGGAGERATLAGVPAAASPRKEAAPADAAATPQPSTAEAGLDRELRRVAKRDAAWDEDVLPYFTEDERAVAELAAALADRGAPAAVSGFELGDSGWPVELAWPARRIAVVLELGSDDGEEHGGEHGGERDGEHREFDHDGDDEMRRRDAAYRAAGWQVRTAADWHDHLDSLIALLDAAPRSAGSPGSPGLPGSTDDTEGTPR